jgi:hypothetical protein
MLLLKAGPALFGYTSALKAALMLTREGGSDA